MRRTGLLLLLLVAGVLAADDPMQQEWKELQEGAASLTLGLPEDQEQGRAIMLERLAAQMTKFRRFLERHPDSAQRWEARMAVLQIENSQAMLSGTEPDWARQAVELQDIAADEAAPEHIRSDASLVLLQFASRDFDRVRDEPSARALAARIDAFLERFPGDRRRPVLLLTKAQANEVHDTAAARKLYEEVAASDNPDLAGAAREGLTQLDLRENPIDISFTAVDGQKLDLADLRGKVVLLDFWATWCPPCVEEAPALVETHRKFKDRGFTIVGISLDQDKSALEKFTEEHGMDWPQFFDGKGWDNEVAKRFKIRSVPTMWLLDREGRLADASPRGRLEQAIETVLAKP